MTTVAGIDLSFDVEKVSAEWVGARRAEGYMVLVADLWTGSTSFNAETALRLWRESGGVTAGYICLNDGAVRTAIISGQDSAGAEWDNLSFIALDIELSGITDYTLEFALSILADQKKQAVIYTSKSKWLELLQDTTRFSSRPLWNASYGITPTLDVDFGGWLKCVSHQYQGTTDLDGISVDLSIWDEGFVMNSQQQIPDITTELDGLWQTLTNAEVYFSNNNMPDMSQAMEDAKQKFIVGIKVKLGIK